MIGGQPLEEWSAVALVYSGQPDPTWPLGQDTVDELLAIWDALPVAPASSSPPTGLGYRGVRVLGPAGATWTAGAGLVQWARRGGTESRADRAHVFERRILRSAPEGLLPPGTLEQRRS